MLYVQQKGPRHVYHHDTLKGNSSNTILQKKVFPQFSPSISYCTLGHFGEPPIDALSFAYMKGGVSMFLV